MKLIGKAVFSNKDDDSGFIYECSVASHAGKLWLVATWRAPTGPGERIPEWLLPLDATGLQRSSPEESVWTGSKVTKELAGPHAEPAAMQRAGAVLNPGLAHIPVPGKTRH